MEPNDPNSEGKPPLELGTVEKLLRKDLREAMTGLGREEARFLVDAYYSMQDARIRASHQERTLEKAEEPNAVLRWLAGQNETLEDQVKRALAYYSESEPLGKWAQSIIGIGPVIAAGLLAHIDIAKAPTAGHIWRFAGLDPTAKWEKGKKRPWNAALKRLCWLIGESFVKTSGNENAQYGPVYKDRKAIEIERNERGEFQPQAQAALDSRKFGSDTEAKIWYEGRITAKNARAIREAEPSKRPKMLRELAGEPGSGVQMLPPARIHLRATRYAVKLFLSHYQHVGHEMLHGQPPAHPYILSREGVDPRHRQHTHFLAPPNWPMPKEK